MKRKTILYCSVFAITLFAVACAQINPLQGGPKDTYAPRIDTIRTTPANGELNFKGNELRFKFDEYVSLNNPADNILITPQLKKAPTITSKNKKVSILFNEDLKENSTYSINFNHAIADITEKNDSVFQFVFSTGNYIDSLQLKGTVFNAFTNAPAEKILVGLYNVETPFNFDSIPIKEKPVYIAQTNAAGEFEMNYLKYGSYYVFAFADKNKNLLIDPSESRGFILPDVINLAPNNEDITIALFEPAAFTGKILRTKFNYPGKLEIITSSNTLDLSVSSSVPLQAENTGKKDSLIYWLASSPTSKMQFELSYKEFVDTIKPLYKDLDRGKAVPDLILKSTVIGGKLLPRANFKLELSEPFDTLDMERIRFLDKDSNVVGLDYPTVDNLRELTFETFEKGNIKTVIIDSAAFTSIYGKTNAKSMTLSFENYSIEHYGAIIITLDTAFQSTVLIDLLDEKDKVIIRQKVETTQTYKDLVPGNYRIRLIFDTDGNGEWTTGSLSSKVLPEKIIYYQGFIDVKSRWEKEIDWQLKTINNGEN